MRAQAHTLEAFVAALLLITGLVFAVQATAVTPLSASTSNQHIENQQRAALEGLLTTGVETGDLKESVLYWDPENGTFYGAHESGQYVDGGPPNAFGAALDESLLERRIAFNVDVRYHTDDGIDAVRMVHMGSPSDNAVAATRSVGLYDSDRLTSPEHDQRLDELNESFYASDQDPDGELFTIVELRIEAWRK